MEIKVKSLKAKPQTIRLKIDKAFAPATLGGADLRKKGQRKIREAMKRAEREPAKEKDPYEHSMDWTAWRQGFAPKTSWRDKLTGKLPTNTMQYRVKETMFNDPDLTLEELFEKVGAKTRSQRQAATNIRADHLHTLKFLIRRGVKGIRMSKE